MKTLKKIISRWLKVNFVFILLFSQIPQINNILAAQKENIALNKSVTASNTDYNRVLELTVDGNKYNSTFWDSERYYKYDIMSSLNGIKFDTATKKENNNISVENGIRYYSSKR